jgi:hypothetical protein
MANFTEFCKKQKDLSETSTLNRLIMVIITSFFEYAARIFDFDK